MNFLSEYFPTDLDIFIIPSSRHSLQRRYRKEMPSAKSRACYSILALLQVLIGGGVTGLSFYIQYTIPDSIKQRDTPHWAGIPLFLAGLVGLYFCIVEFDAWTGNNRAYVVKCICAVLSFISIFLSAVACIFPLAHAINIFHYTACNNTTRADICECILEDEPENYLVSYLTNCEDVFSLLQWFMLGLAVVCAVGSIVSLWFVVLLWRSRYGRFHSGLKFYSYNANVPPHPWANPANPPYCQTTEPISNDDGGQQDPLTLEKEERKMSRAKEEELQLVENKTDS